MPRIEGRPPELSDEEEARVQAGIAADPDNPEWTDEDFAPARPAAEVLPAALYAALTRPGGRPKAEVTKVQMNLGLDRAAVEAFKATGPGWQTRMLANPEKDIAEVRTEEGQLYLLVAIDRTSAFAFAELHKKAIRRIADDFLRAIATAIPYKISTVLTDSGTHFTEPAGNA